jgi:serine/threonine-protein kinase
MATVWKSLDMNLDRPVAVKVLDRARPADPAALERLRLEARTLAHLAHPNIVGVHDFGLDGDVAYLVMELVDGQSLARLLAAGGPLPVGRAVAIADQTCAALAAAHAAGVIHRDVKPGNLIVDRSGTVKVCDFGIVRLQDRGGLVPLTATNAVIGTSEYMAPEQATGRTVDARCDLYALGCVLYAMLSGRPPFTADNPVAVLHQHLHQPPVPLRSLRADVPPELDQLAGELLAKDPGDRPATAALVQQQLETIQAVLTVPPTRSDTVGRGGTRPAAFPPSTSSRSSPSSPSSPSAARSEADAAAAGLPPTRLESVPGPAAHPGESRVPGKRGRRGIGWAAAVVSAAAVVAVVAVALAGLGAFRGDGQQEPSSSAQTPQATASEKGSAAPTPTLSRPTPAKPTDQLAAAVSQQVEAGQLDPDAGRGLLKDLGEIDRLLAEGENRDAAKKAGELDRKLAKLRRDGKLTASGYDALHNLVPLLGSVPGAGDQGGRD